MSEAVIIGAGIAGLSTAWHLQEHGYEVTIVERTGVASGASWGNAGWLAPGKAIPLAHPSLWRYGPQAMFDPDAALSVPRRVDPRLWSFLARFMAHSTHRAWNSTMAALTPIDQLALEAFDELNVGGVQAWTREGPFIVGFEHEAQSKGFRDEVAGAVRHGQEVPFEPLDDPQRLAPQLSDAVKVAFRLEGQRFLEPGPYVEALAEAVIARGAHVRTGADAAKVNSTGRPTVMLTSGEQLSTDTVVIATGAWLPQLARPLGVKLPVQAGRGYSFSVETEQPAQYPIYLPDQRLACTPYQGRFRIAGTMEFRGPDEPFQPRRIRAMVNQAEKLFTGVDLENRQDEWVGSRPVTPDGLPLVGATRAPQVYVAGGHGMWGMVLGPATGKLLAQQIATGTVHAAIKHFDPLR